MTACLSIIGTHSVQISFTLSTKSAPSLYDSDKAVRSDPEMYQCKSQFVCNNSNYLLRWIIALNAKPSRHELVKSVTRTPGYLAVVRLAHLNNASRADTLGSWPTTISDICRKMRRSLFFGEISTITQLYYLVWSRKHKQRPSLNIYALNIQTVRST
jgi:hypothetical protein